MRSDEICEALELSGKLLELHNGNPFKIKAYANASFRLSKVRYSFEGKTLQEIENIEGIGKSISGKIMELVQTGTTSELQELIDKTPGGVIDMLGVKGLGPKKVSVLWRELQVESVGELLYACNENRLITLKGFGAKTQDAIRQSIEYRLQNAQKTHYASVEAAVNTLVEAIIAAQPGAKVMAVGEFRRRCEVLERIDILMDREKSCDAAALETAVALPVHYHHCTTETFATEAFRLTASEDHLNKCGFESLPKNNFSTEEEIYSALSMQYVEPELREGLSEIEKARAHQIPRLIEYGDLRGILHNHSTYSDGLNTLKEMADACLAGGYEYLGICDHSKTAVYANGLSIERVLQQQEEIDALNKSNPQFRVLKGIESDILGDGSLDYPEEILKRFDFIVASIHSNFKMTEEQATQRLIKAIENPCTSILGHPTGRLLLARPGYPVDHKKVIDACAANKVHVELNAHPYRLDIDWRWINYCMEKGVMISVNPDAHFIEGFKDMRYGVLAARKGMLTKEACLNALSLPELLKAFKKH